MASVEWRSIPTVLYPQEILDKAFSRASKQADMVEDPDKYHRVRKQMARMIQSSSDVISTTLLDYVAKWPSLNALSDFDQALVDAAVGADDFKQNLASLQWASDQVNKISGEAQRKILRLRDIDGFHQARRHAYGRFSSIVDQISSPIIWLGDARNVLRKLPAIDSLEPCIVVAGSPNVGKSAMINALSSGEPEVASYPFTTKQLHLGHFSHRRRSYQMVDTPGLLDRPMYERNNIEMQAIAALENIGNLLLFLIDATPGATTPLEEQLNLLKEIKHTIPGKPLLVVHTKIDLFDVIPDDFEYYISAENGEGVEELRKVMIDQIAADYVIDPLVLPDHWHREEDSIKPLGTTQEVLRRYDEGKFL
jgi:nucleolar GTP-binding protein